MKLYDYDISIRAHNSTINALEGKVIKKTGIISNQDIKGVISQICDTRDIEPKYILDICRMFKVKELKFKSNND